MSVSLSFWQRSFRRWLVLALCTATALPAYAVSPYDQYYNQQESGTASAPRAASAPIDNDQYYTAPGQYMPKKNYATPNGQYPATQGESKGCNSISDSPECLGD